MLWIHGLVGEYCVIDSISTLCTIYPMNLVFPFIICVSVISACTQPAYPTRACVPAGLACLRTAKWLATVPSGKCHSGSSEVEVATLQCQSSHGPRWTNGISERWSRGSTALLSGVVAAVPPRKEQSDQLSARNGMVQTGGPARERGRRVRAAGDGLPPTARLQGKIIILEQGSKLIIQSIQRSKH